jgi:hypothetical protein
VRIIPTSLKFANEFVDTNHRHNKHVTGHKFSLALEENKEIIGVAIVGRPIARLLDNGKNIEILRVCVKEGHAGACSKLYARVKQICMLMGYEKIITYTLKSESQSSLKAIGAIPEKETGQQGWNRPSRAREEQKVYAEPKIRWELNSLLALDVKTVEDGIPPNTKVLGILPTIL